MHCFKWPLFSVGIHLNSDTGTRSQRGKKQFVRTGPGVLAAVLPRFIRMEQMMIDGDVLDKSHRSRSNGYASRHFPPLKIRFTNRKEVLHVAFQAIDHGTRRWFCPRCFLEVLGQLTGDAAQIWEIWIPTRATEGEGRFPGERLAPTTVAV